MVNSGWGNKFTRRSSITWCPGFARIILPYLRWLVAHHILCLLQVLAVSLIALGAQLIYSMGSNA